MARGQQKLQSQAKAAEKIAKQKKQQGHNANTQKKAAQAALVHVCSVCKVCNLYQINLLYTYVQKSAFKLCKYLLFYLTIPSRLTVGL